MTTPTPRWTAETEELLHRTLHDLDVRINNLTGDHHCNLVTQVALTALADAGVLIPVGGETYDDGGCPAGSCRSHGFGKHTHRRTLTVWPDGSRHYGPWREVTDDPA